MNEAEWLACNGPMPMLELLRGKASDRKLRHFAQAIPVNWSARMTDRREPEYPQNMTEVGPGHQ